MHNFIESLILVIFHQFDSLCKYDIFKVVKVLISTSVARYLMANTITLDNSNNIEIFEKIFQNKAKQDNVTDIIKEEDLQEIAGRVTRSSEEAHLQYL